MTAELGYERYGAQGGDWGAIISTRLGATHAGNLSGLHLNMALAGPPDPPTEVDEAGLASRRAFQASETGYSNVQGTKPQSLGIAQADSPAGIAAWITEKFRSWSDCDGDVESRYLEGHAPDQHHVLLGAQQHRVGRPHLLRGPRRGCRGSRPQPLPASPCRRGSPPSPKEILQTPRHWVEGAYNLVHWTEMPAGGHFAALEEPDRLLADIRTFFRLRFAECVFDSTDAPR